MRRSMLFLPGNTPNMLINGNCLGADAVIFDLEDAVAPAEKDAARNLVRNTLRYMDFSGCERIVRINCVDTEYWQEDLEAVVPWKPELILLPKAGCAGDVRKADAYMTALEEKLGKSRIAGTWPWLQELCGGEGLMLGAMPAPEKGEGEISMESLLGNGNPLELLGAAKASKQPASDTASTLPLTAYCPASAMPSAHFSIICSGTALAPSSAASSTEALCAVCSGVSLGRL